MADGLALLEPQGKGTMVLTVNRPDKRNALNIALADAIRRAIEEVESDTSQRILIVRGAGPVFCAGLDLLEANDPKLHEPSAEALSRLFETVSQTRLVTICAVHGVAAAGGAGFMAAHDLVVAAEGTRIGYPELLRGLVPALLMTFMMRQVADRHARELLLLGEYVDAHTAHRMALVNRVVAPDRLMDECLQMAGKVILGGPGALATTKQMLEDMGPRSTLSDLKTALALHKGARASQEAHEGLLAFAENRKPHWQE